MPGPTAPALRLLFREAKDVLAAQLDALARMESKAEALARFNLLIVGFIVAGSAAATGRGGVPGGFPVPLLGGGFVLLVIATVLAIASYLKHDIVIGPAGRDIVQALQYDVDEQEILRQETQLYARGIRSNYLQMRVASRRLKWSLWCLTGGILLLSVAAIALIPM